MALGRRDLTCWPRNVRRRRQPGQAGPTGTRQQSAGNSHNRLTSGHGACGFAPARASCEPSRPHCQGAIRHARRGEPPRPGTRAKSVGPQKCRYDCVSRAAIAPLSHRQSLIWIKGRNPFEGFFAVTELSSFSRAAKRKEPLSGSLALAGNELLEQRTWTKFLPRMICERLRESCLTNDSGE